MIPPLVLLSGPPVECGLDLLDTLSKVEQSKSDVTSKLGKERTGAFHLGLPLPLLFSLREANCHVVT